jgi:hypothetical protein
MHKIKCHCEERSCTVRGKVTFVIASPERAKQSHIINCHCEEQSDVAISTFFMRLLRFARNDTGTGVIAALLTVARNDNVIIFSTFVLVEKR